MLPFARVLAFVTCLPLNVKAFNKKIPMCHVLLQVTVTFIFSTWLFLYTLKLFDDH